MRHIILTVGLAACVIAGAGCKGGSNRENATAEVTKGGGAGGVAMGDVSGAYTITSSSNPGGGGSYKGTVGITRAGEAYKLAWTIPGSPAYSGVAIAADTTLGVGWGMGARYGVVVYRVSGGKLQGQWATAGSTAKLGTEDLEGPDGLDGSYKITRASSPDGKSYTGTVAIKPTGDTYSVRWTLPTDSYSGVGIREGDLLVVGWGEAGKGAGVVSYQAAGGALTGKWATPDGTKLGAESLRKN